MKKSAFTLIELLVVISIIAILAGIALPVFTKVQEKGRATQDASNLRQLGLGMTAYLNDNSDTYPTIGTSGSNSWTGKLNPNYVSAWKVFQSPFDKRPPSESGDASTPVSYDMNLNLGQAGKSTTAGDVVSPSNCILLAASMSAPATLTFGGTAGTPGSGINLSSNPGNSSQTGGTHAGGKRINILFADAHVSDMLMIDFHSSLANSDSSSPIKDIRWNK